MKLEGSLLLEFLYFFAYLGRLVIFLRSCGCTEKPEITAITCESHNHDLVTLFLQECLKRTLELLAHNSGDTVPLSIPCKYRGFVLHDSCDIVPVNGQVYYIVIQRN